LPFENICTDPFELYLCIFIISVEDIHRYSYQEDLVLLRERQHRAEEEYNKTDAAAPVDGNKENEPAADNPPEEESQDPGPSAKELVDSNIFWTLLDDRQKFPSEFTQIK
jgi:hypothetical protein